MKTNQIRYTIFIIFSNDLIHRAISIFSSSTPSNSVILQKKKNHIFVLLPSIFRCLCPSTTSLRPNCLCVVSAWCQLDDIQRLIRVNMQYHSYMLCYYPLSQNSKWKLSVFIRSIYAVYDLSDGLFDCVPYDDGSVFTSCFFIFL